MRAVIAGAVALAGAVAGCGGGAPGAGSPVELAEGVEVEVVARDNSFRDESVRVAPGTVVTWTNRGRNDHNVLPVDGDGWGVEVEDFEPGATYSHRFTEPGTYDYYCSLHGTTRRGMVGTVEVSG